MADKEYVATIKFSNNVLKIPSPLDTSISLLWIIVQVSLQSIEPAFSYTFKISISFKIWDSGII